MGFQRARTEDQRDQRKRAILDTVTDMLKEMPVAEVTLNELSRRVGLAKSNVLRYFESREDILLDLLDTELRGWVDHVAGSASEPEPSDGRVAALATLVATSLAERPTLCDLISAQAAVLERNVSTAVVLRHKHATHASLATLTSAIRAWLPALDEAQAYQVVATTMLMTSGTWPHNQPTEALLAAYAADPEVAGHQLEFVAFVRLTIDTLIHGLLAKRQA